MEEVDLMFCGMNVNIHILWDNLHTGNIIIEIEHEIPSLTENPGKDSGY